MVRRILITLVLVLVVSGVAIAWVWWHAQPEPIGQAYVGMSNLALWDGTGPVRRNLEVLPYGEHLVVLGHYNSWTEVRTPSGKAGWVNHDDLIDPTVWRQLGTLAARVRGMTVQARGHTSVLSNLRLDPGVQSPRVGQLRPNTPVQILARGVAAQPGAGRSAGAQAPRKQDWLLVRARTPQMGQIAGWVLGDFINDDVPGALGAYISSTGMSPVAWFKLRGVNDPTQGRKPYYLVAGTFGPEGQACDFTMLRVYTWSVAHQQYETAFVRNGLCGHLPVRVKFEADKERGVLFSFRDIQASGPVTLAYRMVNTLVQPLRPSAVRPSALGSLAARSLTQ